MGPFLHSAPNNSAPVAKRKSVLYLASRYSRKNNNGSVTSQVGETVITLSSKLQEEAMRITTKAGVTNNTRERRKPRFDKQNDSLFLEASPQGMTQWPSEKQIRDVSKKLARINRMAIRAEADGDYFHSGDLAYQMHEIIRATAHLFQSGQRIRRRANGD